MATIPIIAGVLIGNTCTAEGFTASGATPVLALCRALIAAGHDPAIPMRVYRGDVLALRVRSIGEGAKLTVRETTKDGRPRFVRLSGDGQPPRRFPAQGVPTLPADRAPAAAAP